MLLFTCCRCSSVYCLYRRTGADDSSWPARDGGLRAEDGCCCWWCCGAPGGAVMGVAVMARAPLAIWVVNQKHYKLTEFTIIG